jgi:hypothetical protein
MAAFKIKENAGTYDGQNITSTLKTTVKVKHSRYRPDLAQKVDRCITLPFVTSTLEGGGWSAPHPGRFTPGKDKVPIVQEVGWAPGLVWTCANNRTAAGIRSPDRPVRSQSLYRLSYPANEDNCGIRKFKMSTFKTQGASANRAIQQHFFLVQQHWGGCRYQCVKLLDGLN